MTTEQTINELIKNSPKIDTNLISDGYHTFGELYEHRIGLFITLANMMYVFGAFTGDKVPWKSKLHHDGTMWEGWFIAGIGTMPGKQISYHLPIDKWDQLRVVAYDRAPDFDGHTSKDVLERLSKL